jgi:hypothetical protein
LVFLSIFEGISERSYVLLVLDVQQTFIQLQRESLHILEEMLEKIELSVKHKIRKTLMTNEAKMSISVPKQTQNICLDLLKSVV